MLGEGETAEACFVQALAQFDIADLKPEEREGERWQTGIYRAINAMDAQFPQARELVHAIVPLEADAITELAGDGSHKNEYRHHLLVRALYLFPELKNLRLCYLNVRDTWVCGHQHPWELICLYRRLLLLDSEIPGATKLAETHFDKGLRICCDESHGVTLNLIGAMIATIALCATGQDTWRTRASEILIRIETRLPGAAPAMSVLRDALASPSTECIPRVLEALPFNYH